MKQAQAAKYPNLFRTVNRWASQFPPGVEIVVTVDRIAEDRKPRHVAACEIVSKGKYVLYLSPRLESEPSNVRDGVLLHELGHILCFESGEDGHSEREADLSAEQYFGVNIFYDRKTLVQTTRGGFRPRPSHLT